MIESGLINQRLADISTYISTNGYESYDPYDGLASPVARSVLKLGWLFGRLWQQTVRLSPIDFRSTVGIQKLAHTKTISDFASAYSILCSLKNSPQESYKCEEAKKLLVWLSDIGVPTEPGMGWGLRFPFATRFVLASEQTCNIFQTINAIHAFLDGYQILGDEIYLNYALAGFTYAETVLGYVETDDQISWNYWPNLKATIFNVSGLMIGITARLNIITGNDRFALMSRKLCRFITKSQNRDGSWYYSADQRGNWVDGFHTGYILEGLSRATLLGVIDIEDGPLHRGSKYYLENMFDSQYLPKYLSSSTYPIDVQNCAQAIQTLVFLARMKLCSTDQVFSVLKSVDSALWNKRGYYNYYQTRLFTYKTPMHRWGTGPMFLALTYVKTLLESGQ